MYLEICQNDLLESGQNLFIQKCSAPNKGENILLVSKNFTEFISVKAILLMQLRFEVLRVKKNDLSSVEWNENISTEARTEMKTSKTESQNRTFANVSNEIRF